VDEGRGGVAGNGVGFLNGQNTKRDSIALEGEGAVVYSKRAGVNNRGHRRQVNLGHVPNVFREPIGSFQSQWPPP
jgi:hypothetical protein